MSSIGSSYETWDIVKSFHNREVSDAKFDVYEFRVILLFFGHTFWVPYKNEVSWVIGTSGGNHIMCDLVINKVRTGGFELFFFLYLPTIW